MPLPSPQKRERRQDFIKRCMADQVMQQEFPDTKQRYAVCLKQIVQRLKSPRRK